MSNGHVLPEPWVEITPAPTPSERSRKIQRLNGRGKLKIRMEMRNPVIKREWDGHSTTSWYGDERPWWVVVIQRTGGPAEGLAPFFRAAGFLALNDLRTESEDLDEAIAQMLDLSEPRHEHIDELVYGKQLIGRGLVALLGGAA